MEISVKDKYTGCQTMFKKANSYACHFLTLLSIADEENIRLQNKKSGIDFLEARVIAQKMKWMDKDFTVTVEGSLKLLEFYTDRKWSRREVKTLPEIIKDNEYTEAIYKNGETRHYRRRAFDTLTASVTVRDGYVEKYYIYTSEAL